jgi:hypothetical protein
MNDATAELLRTALSSAVPLWIEEMKKLTWEERRVIASESSGIVAHQGDNILYKGAKKGDTAKAFNALARGLAVCSFVPGGVKAFGLHFETIS